MKKLIGGLLVVALLWAGACIAIGMKTETVYKEMLAELELMTGQDAITYQVVDYDRGLFSAQVRSCLMIDPSMAQFAAFSGVLCDLTTVKHGPLVMTPQGPRLALAYMDGAIDLSALPAEVRGLLENLFADQAPLQIDTVLGFNRSAKSTLSIPGFELRDDNLHLRLGSLNMDMQHPDITSLVGTIDLSLNDLLVEFAGQRFALADMDGQFIVSEMIEDILPIITMDLRANGIRFAEKPNPFASTLKEQLAFDLVLQSNSQVNADSLDGNLGLWLNNLVVDASELPIDRGYLGFAFNGLDKAGLVQWQRISNELERLQTEMMVGMMAAFSEQPGAAADMDMEATLAQIESLSEELIQVSSERLLQPGRSKITLTVLADHDNQRQLTLDSQLDYLGHNGRNLPLAELLSLDKAQLATLLDANLTLQLNDALLPEQFAAMGPELVGEGILEHSDSQYAMTIKLADGALSFNGDALTVAEFEQRLASLKPASQAQDELHEVDLSICFDDSLSADSVPAYCIEYGLYPN